MSEQPYDGMPIIDDAGEVVGHAFQAEDGVWTMVRDGQVVTALGPDGSDLDPADFQFDAGDQGPDDPRLVELQDQLAELEHRVSNPEPTDVEQYLQRGGGPDPGDVWAANVSRELENLEASLGRPLTQPEAYRILDDHQRDFAAGVQPDVWKSAANANLADNSTHEGRVQHMTELMGDRARPEDELYDPAPKPSRDVYDLDQVEDRHAYMADRVNGADVEHLAYRSSETSDTEGMD